jgi:hypothetical protein
VTAKHWSLNSAPSYFNIDDAKLSYQHTQQASVLGTLHVVNACIWVDVSVCVLMCFTSISTEQMLMKLACGIVCTESCQLNVLHSGRL